MPNQKYQIRNPIIRKINKFDIRIGKRLMIHHVAHYASRCNIQWKDNKLRIILQYRRKVECNFLRAKKAYRRN